MDFRDVVIGVLVLIVFFLGFFAWTLLSGGRPAVVGPEASGLRVYYLYPSRCVNCDLRVPGQCDFCTSYYDDRVMGTLGADLGVSFDFVISDVVDKPNVFIVRDGKATLVDAKSKYGIAAGLCSFTGVGKACAAFRDEVNRTRECVKKYGVAEDALVYHYSRSECIFCEKTTPVVDSLVGEVSYNESVPYVVRKADDKNAEDKKFLSDCFGSFVNLDFVPQVICPKTGESITGAVEKLSTLREFADKCIEAK